GGAASFVRRGAGGENKCPRRRCPMDRLRRLAAGLRNPRRLPCPLQSKYRRTCAQRPVCMAESATQPTLLVPDPRANGICSSIILAELARFGKGKCGPPADSKHSCRPSFRIP